MKKNYYFWIFLLLGIGLTGCGGSAQVEVGQEPEQAEEVPQETASFAEKVEAAHRKDAFIGKELVRFHLDLWFGGRKRMDAQITMSPSMSRIRMELADGKTLVYDGQAVYQIGDTTAYKSARFDVFTWPYFFAFPFKLSDPGTNWENTAYSSLNGEAYLSEKLTFDQGVGDAPDDWYIAYADKESHRLYAAAYIVTLGRSQEKAEESPHAIAYTDYQMAEGVPFASKWGFWGWEGDKGLTEKLGRAEVSGVSFLPMNKSLFEATTPMKEIE